MTLAPERVKIQALMAETVADQIAHGNWLYEAVRPQTIISTYVRGIRVKADCSDGVRCLARIVGVKDDPAGNGYAPYGNSSSIWAHSEHIPLSEAQPGDNVTFGYYAGEKHACALWEKYGAGDTDWYVWNHGAPGQPAKRRLIDEISNHIGMRVTVCALNVKDPPPTPEDNLREQTGFYAWVAWRLGEGPWKKYGQTNSKVRPAVPTVIPPSWWRDLSRFLLNRKKPNRKVEG